MSMEVEDYNTANDIDFESLFIEIVVWSNIPVHDQIRTLIAKGRLKCFSYWKEVVSAKQVFTKKIQFLTVDGVVWKHCEK